MGAAEGHEFNREDGNWREHHNRPPLDVPAECWCLFHWLGQAIWLVRVWQHESRLRRSIVVVFHVLALWRTSRRVQVCVCAWFVVVRVVRIMEVSMSGCSRWEWIWFFHFFRANSCTYVLVRSEGWCVPGTCDLRRLVVSSFWHPEHVGWG